MWTPYGYLVASFALPSQKPFSLQLKVAVPSTTLFNKLPMSVRKVWLSDAQKSITAVATNTVLKSFLPGFQLFVDEEVNRLKKHSISGKLVNRGVPGQLLDSERVPPLADGLVDSEGPLADGLVDSDGLVDGEGSLTEPGLSIDDALKEENRKNEEPRRCFCCKSERVSSHAHLLVFESSRLDIHLA